MKRTTINILLIGIVLMDLLGNSGVTVLIAIKYLLLLVCLILNNWGGEKSEQ